jgi:hypothetical protein
VDIDPLFVKVREAILPLSPSICNTMTTGAYPSLFNISLTSLMVRARLSVTVSLKINDELNIIKMGS